LFGSFVGDVATAPGSRFPLPDAHDPDWGRNSLQSYELSGDEHFSLAVQAGPGGDQRPELVLAKALDREEAAFHELVLRAIDGGDPARTGTARIRVTVLDANDNAPVFSQAEYTVRVPEDVPVGSTLVTVTLVLTAVDSGDPSRSGTVQVRVNVTDANDNPPVFSKVVYEARVAENPPAGLLVLQVRATDADAGSNGRVSYSFGNVPEAVRGLFTVDSESGEIRTAGPLDFEEKPIYIFGLEAMDGGGLTDHCEVQIDITDENDNAPEITILSLSSPVPEDAPVGTVVALLNVNDPDSGENGQVSCELSEVTDNSFIMNSSPLSRVPPFF
uniref:Uncharacterized protein n=1 Tax=Corvus moneduloides TaxID=1196302 RepID=A0A8U7P6U7_CORMO